MTSIKICGLKTIHDVETVNKCLPEYVGFVFANTKRFVTDEQAYDMKQALNKQIKAVGVFVDEPIDHVSKLYKTGIIDVAQLHGNEDEEYIRKLKKETDIPVIKAVKVRSANQVVSSIPGNADIMLFDTYKKGELGGTGERFTLSVLDEALQMISSSGNQIVPYFIAGGLSSDNVYEVISKSDCYGVDVSTGVETDGVKDEEKIKEFISKVRNNEVYSQK